MRQPVSNACYDHHYHTSEPVGALTSAEMWGTCLDCGGHAPDGRPCACECHQTREEREQEEGEAMFWRLIGAGQCIRCESSRTYDVTGPYDCVQSRRCEDCGYHYVTEI